MRGLRRALVAVGAAGVLVGLAEIPLVLGSNHVEARGVWLALTLVTGWGFLGAGLFAWARRPDNRIGSLMVLTAFLWFLQAAVASDLPLVFTIAGALSNVFAAGVIHLMLAFPDGELHGRLDRIVVATGYFVTTVGLLPVMLTLDPADDGCEGCPDNIIQVADEPGIAEAGDIFASSIGIVVLALVVATLVRRWRAATVPQRRVLGPVYLTGGVLLVMLAIALLVDFFGWDDFAEAGALLVGYAAFAAVPYVFLGGLLRSRLMRGGAVSDLLARLAETPGPGELRDALARALRDDTLTLAYHLPAEERWVDARGRQVTLPEEGSDRVATLVERDGECIGAIICDRAVAEDGQLLEAVGGAAALALENERLEAELRSRLEELRASRSRIVEAGVAERRRLERDLHDGAQQRLVSLALGLRVARNKLPDDPEGAASLLEGAGAELDLALAELRELARGIHPAVLSDRGLGAALESLAGRAPLPVELEHRSEEPLPEAVESAAYFVVAEALTNVAKYAGAESARVEVVRENGHVRVSVSDDGRGGADPERGTGLRGLGDRVAALDGRIEIDSRPGRGTTVRAEIPCG